MHVVTALAVAVLIVFLAAFLASLMPTAFANRKEPEPWRLLKVDYPRICWKRHDRPFEKHLQIFGDENDGVRFAKRFGVRRLERVRMRRGGSVQQQLRLRYSLQDRRRQ